MSSTTTGANWQHRDACWVHCRGKMVFFKSFLPKCLTRINCLLFASSFACSGKAPSSLWVAAVPLCIFPSKAAFQHAPCLLPSCKKLICKEFLRLDSICAHLGSGAGRFCCVHPRGRMILGTAGVLVSQAGHLTKLSGSLCLRPSV